jgi:urea carboxylase
VNAVIPGYGFLSENHKFAEKLASNGVAFVGPNAGTIKSFGLKHTARDLANSAGVPIVPGSQGLIETEDEAVQTTRQIGLPVRRCQP